MRAKQLHSSFLENKKNFQGYINIIKENSKLDIYTIINPTLIKNPYVSGFPENFFLQKLVIRNKYLLFLRTAFVFYCKSLYLYCSFLISILLFKIFCKKKTYLLSKATIGIDVFLLIDNIIKNEEFNENYFQGLYEVLDMHHKDYFFIPRLIGTNKNPFKLIKFFKIINKDKRNFLFEYQLFSFLDLLKIVFIIICYPFKTLNLLQKEKAQEDLIFNIDLIKDIKFFSFESIKRYFFGRNLAKTKFIKKIYSWSEFQVIERSFNYGIRTTNDEIKLFGCQFYLNYETYFNSSIDDLDYKQKTSPHEVLVNGKVYIKPRKNVQYKKGVSLRYKNIFSHKRSNDGDNILMLGSYIIPDTKLLLESVLCFKKVLFKPHPATSIAQFKRLNNNIYIVSDNIYKLFETSNILISTASGTSVEAVACGLSVIIIASQDNLTANPLVAHGKGKIWDIAFDKNEVEDKYNQLMNYRKENPQEIVSISKWYKDNFFIEPTEENILKAFDFT